ncbi:hypothetical protein Tco_0621768 [Tanacetum coccineum]
MYFFAESSNEPPGLVYQWAWSRTPWTSAEQQEITELMTLLSNFCLSNDNDSWECTISKSSHIETEEHLFVSCEVAKEIWSKVLSWWKIRNISITCLPDAINLADRVQMPNHLVAFFDAVVQSTIWFLWRFRNDMSFSLKRPSKDLILNDIKLASYNWISSRGRSVRLNWIEWFDNPCNTRCN